MFIIKLKSRRNIWKYFINIKLIKYVIIALSENYLNSICKNDTPNEIYENQCPVSRTEDMSSIIQYCIVTNAVYKNIRRNLSNE